MALFYNERDAISLQAFLLQTFLNVQIGFEINVHTKHEQWSNWLPFNSYIILNYYITLHFFLLCQLKPPFISPYLRNLPQVPQRCPSEHKQNDTLEVSVV